MSPYFVKHFRSNNPCPSCTIKKVQDRAPGRSLCASHLTIARLAWRLWAIDRRETGRCVSCNRKSVKNNCRCRAHREDNRVNCQKWSNEHPERSALAWEKRKEVLSTGFCVCSAKLALAPGQRRCNECREFNAAIDRGDIAVQEKIRSRRQARKVAKAKTVADEAQQQLAAMGYQWSVGTSSVRRIEA